MDKPADTRNWRCFFGVHQWEVVASMEFEKYESNESTHPYKIFRRYTQKCAHCGQMTNKDL